MRTRTANHCVNQAVVNMSQMEQAKCMQEQTSNLKWTSKQVINEEAGKVNAGRSKHLKQTNKQTLKELTQQWCLFWQPLLTFFHHLSVTLALSNEQRSWWLMIKFSKPVLKNALLCGWEGSLIKNRLRMCKTSFKVLTIVFDDRVARDCKPFSRLWLIVFNDRNDGLDARSEFNCPATGDRMILCPGFAGVLESVSSIWLKQTSFLHSIPIVHLVPFGPAFQLHLPAVCFTPFLVLHCFLF